MKITIRHNNTEVIVNEVSEASTIHYQLDKVINLINSICENVIKLDAQKNEGV